MILFQPLLLKAWSMAQQPWLHPGTCCTSGAPPENYWIGICILCRFKVIPTRENCCSVAQSCLTLCNPTNCNTPGFSVLRYLPILRYSQSLLQLVHWVDDVIQLSLPLSPPSPLALNLFQHQGLFQWLGSSHQVAKEWDLRLQHQSFQWIFRSGFL